MLAHAITDAREVLVVVATDGDVCTAVRGSADGELAALLMVTDRAPVPLRDPVRAQVWLSGWLARVPDDEQRELALQFADVAPVGPLLDIGTATTLLRFDLAEVVLREGGAVREVEPADFLAADPDPLSAVEAEAIAHLDQAHPEAMALLRSRVPAEWLGPHAEVRPLGLDRCGLRLRIEQPGETRDVRVPFSAPITRVDELGPAVQRLLCAARHGCACAH